jgi:hypothetical protein
MAIGCASPVSGNVDLGIYDAGGERLVSSGSVPMSASAAVIVDIADTKLGRGRYFIAVAISNTSNVIGNTGSTDVHARLLGMRQMDSAFPLPATATFSSVSQAVVPAVSVYLRAA